MLASRLGEANDGGRWSTSTHVAVRTSEEAAQVRGATLASGAKAMLLATKPSDKFVLAVISAAEKMDSKAFKKAGSFKATKFATEDEVFALTGCRPGAVTLRMSFPHPCSAALPFMLTTDTMWVSRR